MWRTVLLVAVGGGIGSALRYLTSVFIVKCFAGSLPVATFLANLIGCFAIGLLMGYFLKTQTDDSQMRFLLVTGFCGGYTTFSAFAFENVTLIQQHNYTAAFAYIALSIVLGLAAVWCGLVLNR